MQEWSGRGETIIESILKARRDLKENKLSAIILRALE